MQITNLITAEVARAAIHNEVISDPTNRGYAGKTNEEIANLLNTCVDDVTPPRINTIFVGIAFAPNAVDAEDVDDSMN